MAELSLCSGKSESPAAEYLYSFLHGIFRVPYQYTESRILKVHALLQLTDG